MPGGNILLGRGRKEGRKAREGKGKITRGINIYREEGKVTLTTGGKRKYTEKQVAITQCKKNNDIFI